MADRQSNAPLRAPAGAPSSGVIHVRTRLDADFTVISNRLAQRTGSAVTVGVAAYILSLPDGVRIRIEDLCAHFTEGEILIARALRELEADGYLERLVGRGGDGRLHTRTLFHDVPPRGAGPEPDPPPQPPQPPQPPRPSRPRRTAPIPGPAPEGPAPTAPAPAPEAAAPAPGPAHEPHPGPAHEPDPGPDPRAASLLAALRLADPRLILSRREVESLAPAVAEWLAHGVAPEDLTAHLTDRLPAPLRARPARILAYRLRELPPPLPATSPPAGPGTPVLPWQTCDGCERAVRAPYPGARCRDCPPGAEESARVLEAAC